MFRTELSPAESREKISYDQDILTIGSCFSEIIGSRLELNKFKVLNNPFGIIFNPLAQFKLINYSLQGNYPDDYTYVQSQDVWYNYDFHSDFSALSRDELSLQVEGSINHTKEFLINTDWLILTFGTSIGYHLKSNGELVANCHKIPAAEFNKSFISQKQIISGFEAMYDLLKSSNPQVKVLLTVSPVRHLKETLELNSVSKSILRISAHSLQENFEDVSYFPAYELLLDDLRDYRFYSKNLLHPNEMGQDYIWEKFTGAYLHPQSSETVVKWEKVRRSLDHKPFHSGTPKHKKFLETVLEQLNNLQGKINVSKEIDKVKKKLGEI